MRRALFSAAAVVDEQHVGHCTRSGRQQAGYDAAIVFNEGQEGRRELLTGTLGNPVDIPVAGTSYADGAALAQTAGATVHVTAKTEVDLNRTSTNVIADLPRKTKNPDQVVVGAHLDSVAAGPGINVNGSGTAAVLEIAKQFKKTGLAKKAVRPVTSAVTRHATRSATSAPRHWTNWAMPQLTRLVYWPCRRS